MVSWTALRKSLGGSNVANSTTIDATLSGLRARPADPLILCINVDGRPLRGLSAQVDWRPARHTNSYRVGDPYFSERVVHPESGSAGGGTQ